MQLKWSDINAAVENVPLQNLSKKQVSTKNVISKSAVCLQYENSITQKMHSSARKWKNALQDQILTFPPAKF